MKRSYEIFGLVRFFFIFIALLWVLSKLEPTNNRPTSSLETSDPRLIELISQINRMQNLNNQGQYLQALSLTEKIEQPILDNPGITSEWRYRYFLNCGDIHWNLWHFVDAEDCWQKAMKEPFQTSRKALQERLRQLSQTLKDANQERTQQLRYDAAPRTGPAAELKGKIAVAYVFVKLPGSDDWSIKNRQAAGNAWLQANRWLSDRARDYQQTVRFSQRLFVVDRHPALKRIKINSDRDAQRQADKIIRVAMNALGAPSARAFIQKIKAQEKADQVILLFHVNQKRRSFAFPCRVACNSYFSEFAFVYEASGFKRWQSMQYAMAHESLHLFGADDLYNINGAQYYSPRDIMNYPSRHLYASQLDELTAWSVGLKKQQPATPFPVKKY